jgi:hypothetical protein
MALKGACASDRPGSLSFTSFMVNPPTCILNSKVDGLALCKKTRTHTNISVRKPHLLEDYCLLERKAR